MRVAVLALAAGLALGACTQTHDCRPGTLFLDVHFAPYTGVSQVYVQVMVAGETTRSKTFAVPSATAEGGGIEVDFATYPTGKQADVLVRLDGAAGPLATRPLSVDAHRRVRGGRRDFRDAGRRRRRGRPRRRRPDGWHRRCRRNRRRWHGR